MIYTVTPNPSLDYYLSCKQLVPGATNRAGNGSFVYGGKGINVACVCKNLGLEVSALGFYAGFTGEELIRLLQNDGVNHRFVRTAGNTRINVKCQSVNGITEINAPGAEISSFYIDMLCDKLSDAKRGDTVVMSGSQPPCEIRNIFTYIMDKLSGRGISFVIDTSGIALTECFEYSPELIKPNYRELCGLFNKAEIPENEIPEYCKQILSSGVKSIIVSLGERGAVMCTQNKTEICRVPDCGYTALNPTGAGDSMIAGYLYAKKHGLPELHYAVAAGCSTAYSQGLCSLSMMNEIAELISINDKKTV